MPREELTCVFRVALLLFVALGTAVAHPAREVSCITTSPLVVELEAVPLSPGGHSAMTHFALMRIRNRSDQPVKIKADWVAPTGVVTQWDSRGRVLPKRSPPPPPPAGKQRYIKIAPGSEWTYCFSLDSTTVGSYTDKSYTAQVRIHLYQLFYGVEWNVGDSVCSNICVFSRAIKESKGSGRSGDL